jgi:hypothetical protein
MGEWAFSTRRMNTHVLKLVGQRDGLVVVDSTRRGKSEFFTEGCSGGMDIDC